MKVKIKIESQVEKICRDKFLKVNLRIISFHLNDCEVYKESLQGQDKNSISYTV
jgi:hypothetical protein